MTSEQFPLNDTPESASLEDPQVSNPWEGPIIPLDFSPPAKESTSDSPNKFHERGSEAVNRIGGMLADATEAPREAAKAKLRKIGRGALSAVKGALRVAGYAPLTATGAVIEGAESYIANVKSNINTIANATESAKALTSNFIDTKSYDLNVSIENSKETIKDTPTYIKRGLGNIALGFRSFRGNRKENSITKQEQRLAKSKEELSDINQSIETSNENQELLKQKTAEVRAEARRKRAAAEAHKEERRQKLAQFREMGQSA